MFNRKNKEKGFTLIELLIVIAIIGVLAATVVVSLGDQTATAKKETTKIGVSSVRSLATAEVASPTGGTALTGKALCGNIHGRVSAKGKSDWTWKAVVDPNDGSITSTTCSRLSLTTGSGFTGEEGEICCHAEGTKWIVWGALADSDGTGTANSGSGSALGKDVYCSDDTGFLGEVSVLPVAVAGKGSIANAAKVSDSVLRCKD